MLKQIEEFLKKHLAGIIFLLFAIQPLMDVLSYWLDHVGKSTTLALLLRMAVLAATVLLGYMLSRNKKAYWILAIVSVVYFAMHASAMLYVGYVSPFEDITNYVRVIQIPWFTFCFITFMKTEKRAFRWICAGCGVAFAIISVIVLLSVVTGTYAHTYEDTQTGVLGWFATTNSQAAIMSMLTPIVLYMTYRSKKLPLFILTAIASCLQLYLLGTRLAYLSIFAALFGLILVAWLCGKAEKKRCIAMAAVALVCVLGFKASPMYDHSQIYNQEMASKQSNLNTMTSMRNIKVDKEGGETEEERDLTYLRSYNQIYAYYCSDLVQRFGLEKVMEHTNFSTDVASMTGARKNKIFFCSLLMQEQPFTAEMFGVERAHMEYKGKNYDVENDFHGIYFLYGIVGLVLFLGFLAYFLYLIGWALIKDIRKYFTMEAGTFGIALVLALITAYNTAGILRRPNASFYLSVILAVIYYLVRVKTYSPNASKAPLLDPLFNLVKKKKTSEPKKSA